MPADTPPTAARPETAGTPTSLDEAIAQDGGCESCGRPIASAGATPPRKYDQTPSGCWAACIAGLTGLSHEQLAAFVPRNEDGSIDGSMGTEYHNAVNVYLRANGWRIVHLGTDKPLGFAIGSGISPRGIEHAVITLNGELWHDPHPSRAGIVGEWTQFEVLVPLASPVADAYDSLKSFAPDCYTYVTERLAVRGDGDDPALLPCSRPGELGAGEMRVTNYKLAHELSAVAEWILRHAFSGVDGNASLALITRAQNALRGATEPITSIRELLLNDPWAAAIASYVRAEMQRATPSSAPSAAGPETPPDELLIADRLRGAVALPPEEAPTRRGDALLREAIERVDMCRRLNTYPTKFDGENCSGVPTEMLARVLDAARKTLATSERGTAPDAEEQEKRDIIEAAWSAYRAGWIDGNSVAPLDFDAKCATANRHANQWIKGRIRTAQSAAPDADTTRLDDSEWRVRPGRVTWTEARSILLQGTSIQQDYDAGRYANYEQFAARLDAAAREIEKGSRFYAAPATPAADPAGRGPSTEGQP